MFSFESYFLGPYPRKSFFMGVRGDFFFHKSKVQMKSFKKVKFDTRNTILLNTILLLNLIIIVTHGTDLQF